MDVQLALFLGHLAPQSLTRYLQDLIRGKKLCISSISEMQIVSAKGEVAICSMGEAGMKKIFLNDSHT